MAEDIKKIAKSVSDMEKRLKFVEDRGKILADSITSSKDIEKLLDLQYKKMSNDPEFSNKAVQRELELKDKLQDAQFKEQDKEAQKIQKQVEKMNKDLVSEAKFQMLEARVKVLEALVSSILRR